MRQQKQSGASREPRAENLFNILNGAYGDEAIERALQSWDNALMAYSNRLDALLLQEGEDIFKLQEATGIRLIEYRDLSALEYYIGSYRLAQKYIADLHPTPDTPTEPANTPVKGLPSELDTERARKYFARAVEVGYMTPTGTGYKWNFGGERGCLARLGYFVERVYCPKNTEQLPEQSINKLFVVNRIASAITQLHNAKKPQKWRAEIDNKIFFD